MLSLEKPGLLSTPALLTSPYSLKESFGWVKRFVFGLSKKNYGNVQYLPKTYQINEINPKYTISFIGDIMDLNFKDLIIHKSVVNFVRNSDFLIGNFEGTLSSKKKVLMNKQHKPQIMDALETLLPPNKIYLSVANNHSGDFGKKQFFHSMRRLKKQGFNVFGTLKNPFIDLSEDLRVIGATQWSNRPCSYLVKLDHAIKYLKNNSFNIFFPHWGYEMELYPREEIIKQSEAFLNSFDLLISHHSHCPQPISIFKYNNTKKLVAYSLGDFCFSIDNKKFESYNYGIAIKAQIGLNKERKWVIGKVKWTFLKSSVISKRESIVKTASYFSDVCN